MRNQTVLWLRGLDLNQRPPGYELRWVSPPAAPQCFPGLLGPEIAQNPKVVPLRSTGILPCLGHRFGSAEKAGLAKESGPLFDYFTAPGLDDPQDIPKNAIRYLGIVVAQQTLPGFRDPDLRGIGRRRTLCDMDVNRLQRVIFICPEVHPLGPNLKNLRHARSLRPLRIQE